MAIQTLDSLIINCQIYFSHFCKVYLLLPGWFHRVTSRFILHTSTWIDRYVNEQLLDWWLHAHIKFFHIWIFHLLHGNLSCFKSCISCSLFLSHFISCSSWHDDSSVNLETVVTSLVSNGSFSSWKQIRLTATPRSQLFSYYVSTTYNMFFEETVI